MDLLDVLRRQASRFQCPECGKSLADCRLDLVAKADEQSLVRVTCANCEHARLIAVGVAAPAEDEISAPVRDELVDPAAPGISADEMLDVRLTLAAYEGDLKGILA